MDENPADSSGEEAKIGRFSRRSVIRYGSMAGVAAFGGAGALALGTGGARAEVSGASLMANKASVSSDDGTITGVTLQDETKDDNAGIDFAWEGFDQTDVTVTFTLKAGLTGSKTGETETGMETMLSGSSVVSEMSGEVSLDWADALGASSVSLIDEHTGIDLSSFESSTDSEDRIREMKVTLIADATHDNGDVEVVAESSATADLTTTNIDGTGSTGGTVDTNMTA